MQCAAPPSGQQRTVFAALGPDTGYDATHDTNLAAKLSAFLNNLSLTGEVPRRSSSLNPKDYYTLATLMGCYQDRPGKMQLGAWWFADHKTAERIGSGQHRLLSLWGMLTDSRSFLSTASTSAASSAISGRLG